MNPLLQQFIQEARELLQDISTQLLELENTPDAPELMTELFRKVHTLKGNSGLFEFPEMTRVLHAGEDLMDAVRDRHVVHSRILTDQLLDAMDFVSMLIDEIEQSGSLKASYASTSDELARALNALIPRRETSGDEASEADTRRVEIPLPSLASLPEKTRIAAWRQAEQGTPLFLIGYRPDEACFFKGEDPLHQARQIPGLLWGGVVPREAWPALTELDCYRCQIDFHILAAVTREELQEHFRYTPEQIRLEAVDPLQLIIPAGHKNGGPVYGDFVVEALELLNANDLAELEISARTLLDLSSPDLWLSSALRWLLAVLETRPDDFVVLRGLIEALNTLTHPDLSSAPDTLPSPPPSFPPSPAPDTTAVDHERIEEVLAIQADILALPDTGNWLPGRIKAVATTLQACLTGLGEPTDDIESLLATSLTANSAQPLRDWLTSYRKRMEPTGEAVEPETELEWVLPPDYHPEPARETLEHRETASDAPVPVAFSMNSETRMNRVTPAEDSPAPKVLKVDQIKIDHLMNLIGEMVVAKNSLPYLANRAENQYGVRELAREIKSQYAVINRIAEEMQDAIMQVRMMPVSFIFKRFPRLIRDLSRKLGKEVELVLEGEETEADKNIIECLSDPLIHIIRNSLDHGLETPAVREAQGKPRIGRLLIRATQESDRVMIEISDDGKGIDPAIVKRKAYEKGVIDEALLDRISDQDALNLIFTAGFSTAESVTDLSGRGVGMDVVHNVIDKIGGTIELSSQIGKGTTLRLYLPLSMAITNVMIIESDQQIFGIPMDRVVETVRLAQDSIRTIKHKKTTVLRGRIIPLLALNELLAIDADPKANADGEIATLVVRIGHEQVGLMVDEFRNVVDVILKPLPGELFRLSCYAGSALLGDGSVLMVLNPRELF